jgi:hypothetical protein
MKAVRLEPIKKPEIQNIVVHMEPPKEPKAQFVLVEVAEPKPKVLTIRVKEELTLKARTPPFVRKRFKYKQSTLISN